jgi:hypothetical protein
LPDPLFDLFDEYAVRYARGEQPDPVLYLDRAGDDAEALAEMIDRFLQWAPPSSPDDVAVALMRAWLAGEPPLRELRVQRGLRVEDVVRQLSADFDVDVAQVGKLRRYFQRLERGALDPVGSTGVSSRRSLRRCKRPRQCFAAGQAHRAALKRQPRPTEEIGNRPRRQPCHPPRMKAGTRSTSSFSDRGPGRKSPGLAGRLTHG